jgi:3-(3-hydroxy-phenyl)propionate hydroxylase
MFPQPRVGTADGTRLLDDAIGAGFAVIGPQVEPAVAADPVWAGLPVRFLRVLPAGADPTGADDVVDVDGVLGRWFTRHRADLAVLRPDRFVFGVASDASAMATLGSTLRNRLHVTGRLW